VHQTDPLFSAYLISGFSVAFFDHGPDKSFPVAMSSLLHFLVVYLQERSLPLLYDFWVQRVFYSINVSLKDVGASQLSP
jgi:hypothetical protein